MATWTTPSSTLAAFLAASCNTTPADSANASELAQIDLQTRAWLYNFLSVVFNSGTPTLKAAAVDSDTLVGKVQGSASNAVDAAAVHLVPGTVSTNDLRAEAVTTAKIADLNVTAAKIAAGTITATQLADDCVTSGKILTGAVIADSIGALAVDTAAIADDAVTSAKLESLAGSEAVTSDVIRDGAVGADALAVGTEGQILIAAATTGKFSPQTVSGAATISATGVVTLTNYGIEVLAERTTSGTPGGESVACTTWASTVNVRGAAVGWASLFYTSASALATIEAGLTGHFNLVAGTYVLEATAPGYKVGKHITRLRRFNSSDQLQDTFYGSSESSAAADACTTTSKLFASFACLASDYFIFDHWTEVNQLTNGLGLPASCGDETYAQIKIHRLS